MVASRIKNRGKRKSSRKAYLSPSSAIAKGKRVFTKTGSTRTPTVPVWETIPDTQSAAGQTVHYAVNPYCRSNAGPIAWSLVVVRASNWEGDSDADSFTWTVV